MDARRERAYKIAVTKQPRDVPPDDDGQQESSSFADFADMLRAYWAAYGGVHDMVRSPLFWLSVVITAAQFRAWRVPGWWEAVTAILPNVLGFTIGGYAILMGFGSESFRNALAGRDLKRIEEDSPFMQLNATFVHAAIVQLLAIVWALTARSYCMPVDGGHECARSVGLTHLIGWGVGHFLFVYSLALAFGLVASVFNASRLYDWHRTGVAIDDAKEKAVEQAKALPPPNAPPVAAPDERDAERAPKRPPS